MRMRRRGGITLIELFMVLTGIATTAAAALPALRRDEQIAPDQ